MIEMAKFALKYKVQEAVAQSIQLNTKRRAIILYRNVSVHRILNNGIGSSWGKIKIPSSVNISCNN